MPIKPKPVRFTCPRCGWEKTFAPRSDVLMCAPPDRCEKCGNPDLDAHEILTAQSLVEKITTLFK